LGKPMLGIEMFDGTAFIDGFEGFHVLLLSCSGHVNIVLRSGVHCHGKILVYGGL